METKRYYQSFNFLLGCTTLLLPLEGEANIFFLLIIFYLRRCLIECCLYVVLLEGEKCQETEFATTLKRMKNFPILKKIMVLMEASKSKKGKWIGVSNQCKNLKKFQYVHWLSKLKSAQEDYCYIVIFEGSPFQSRKMGQYYSYDNQQRGSQSNSRDQTKMARQGGVKA